MQDCPLRQRPHHTIGSVSLPASAPPTGRQSRVPTARTKKDSTQGTLDYTIQGVSYNQFTSLACRPFKTMGNSETTVPGAKLSAALGMTSTTPIKDDCYTVQATRENQPIYSVSLLFFPACQH